MSDNISRRFFIKGLYFAASSALYKLPVFNVVNANDLNFAKVETYFFSLGQGPKKIVLDDDNDRESMLRNYIKNTLNYMNKNAGMYNGSDYERILTVKDQVKLLQPMKEAKNIAKYVLITDQRNHTQSMYDQGITNLDVCIQPINLTGHFGFRFTYDPTVI